MTNHLVALAIPVLVAFGSVSVEAQRPVNDRTLDQIPIPELPMLPDDGDERKILTDVRNTPAFNLDDALPPLELDQWLTATLLSYNPSAARVEWRLERCEDFSSDLPSESSELCAEAKSANISQSEEKTLTLILVVGDWRQASDGRSGWVVRPPAFRDLFIQTAADSLDIRSLSELTTAFSLPVEQWPTAEFELAVNASPLRALPGETVTLRIEVRNKGKRDAPRAEVTFAVFLGETPADSKRYDYKWYPGIAAGRTVAVDLPVELPDGRGVFSASAKAFGTRKRFKETVIPRKSTFLWVHQVTDPPGLPVTGPR